LKPRECQISLRDGIGNIEGHVRCISLLGFNNSSWHTSESGNDRRRGRRVLWRKILVGIVDTQLYLLARPIEEFYIYIINFWVLRFSYFMDVLESVHFRDRDTYEVKPT